MVYILEGKKNQCTFKSERQWPFASGELLKYYSIVMKKHLPRQLRNGYMGLC